MAELKHLAAAPAPLPRARARWRNPERVRRPPRSGRDAGNGEGDLALPGPVARAGGAVHGCPRRRGASGARDEGKRAEAYRVGACGVRNGNGGDAIPGRPGRNRNLTPRARPAASLEISILCGHRDPVSHVAARRSLRRRTRRTSPPRSVPDPGTLLQPLPPAGRGLGGRSSTQHPQGRKAHGVDRSRSVFYRGWLANLQALWLAPPSLSEPAPALSP